VEDLGSKNGTHVNGQELGEAAELSDGDEIQIALRFKLAFVDAGATAPLTLEGGEQGLRLDKETRQGSAIEPTSIPSFGIVVGCRWQRDQP
jgi:pSer/pThr/pTyr-binding forkhead associated (FHA) protein